MADPTISVLVTSWCDEDHITDSLNSILFQTYPKQDTEILISNDAATDRTPELIREWQRKYQSLYNKVTVIQRNERLGRPAPYRNEMIDQSRGKIIVPLDGDDRWKQEKVYSQAKVLSGDTAFCATGYEWINKKGDPLNISMSLPTQSYDLEDLLKKPVLITSAVAWNQTKTGKMRYREEPEYTGWEDQKFYADWLSKDGHTIYVMNDIMMQYRVLSTSGSARYPLHMRPVGTLEIFQELAKNYSGDPSLLFNETQTFLFNRAKNWDDVGARISAPTATTA